MDLGAQIGREYNLGLKKQKGLMSKKLRFCVNPKFLPNFPGSFPESDFTVIYSFSVWDEGTRGRKQDRFLP